MEETASAKAVVVKEGPHDLGEGCVGAAVGASAEVGVDVHPLLETTFPFLSHFSFGFALYTATGAVLFAAGPWSWLAQDLKDSRVFPWPGHTALFTVVQECWACDC